MVGLLCLMPLKGLHPITYLFWLLEGRISSLHRPELNLTHYPGKVSGEESSGSWNPIRGCSPALGGRGSLGHLCLVGSQCRD